MKLWTQFILLLVALISIPSYAATVRYQHTDMLGSVVSESDASGNIISRSHYEPFGKRIGGDKEGIGYTGHLQDKDLGLTYMQARYYDPLIGRFYSNDPIGFRDVHSFNRYAYANNNPYMYTDPDGKAAESWLNRPAGVSIQQNQNAYTGATAIAAVVWTAGAAEVSPFIAAILVGMETSSVATGDIPSSLGVGAKLSLGKQGKHQPTHNNFQPGKSELTHSNPQGLLDKRAGTGQQVGNSPIGSAGSKERVDFGEPIGNYVDPATGNKQSTSVGIIHYSKGDAHIVPARPLEESK